MKGKEAALEEIQGNWEESYSLLPSYMVQLLGVTPMTQTRLAREVDGSFLRFFVNLEIVW